MPKFRSSVRRVLDRRLMGLDVKVGPPPQGGWIRTIRQALGMSTYELAERIGVAQPRVTQLERAEAIGSIQLRTLERAAEGLNCVACYVLVPREPLEHMVHRQALTQAARQVAASMTDQGLRTQDQTPWPHGGTDQIEALAEELVDRRGLWRTERTLRSVHPVGGVPGQPELDNLGQPRLEPGPKLGQ